MTATAPSERLEAGRRRAGLSVRDLWVGYCAIGGTASPQGLADHLRGRPEPGAADYDLVAQALNDHLIDQGLAHPVPYADELP